MISDIFHPHYAWTTREDGTEALVVRGNTVQEITHNQVGALGEPGFEGCAIEDPATHGGPYWIAALECTSLLCCDSNHHYIPVAQYPTHPQQRVVKVFRGMILAITDDAPRREQRGWWTWLTRPLSRLAVNSGGGGRG